MSLNQQRFIEFLGTAFFVMMTIGSSITAGRFAPGNIGLAVLIQSLVLSAGIYILVAMFKPGVYAQFNPVITLFFILEKKISLKEGFGFILAQIAGGTIGLMLTHIMFNLPLFEIAERTQNNWNNYISELIVTYGLLLTIWNLEWNFDRVNAKTTAGGVALYVFCMIWFTDCTWYANPLIGILRGFTASPAAVSSSGTLGFLAAQAAAFLLFIGTKKILKFSVI